jgi:hypothetical protein
MNPVAPTIKLFCWILNHSENAFSVKIQDDEMVDDLKKAIVKEASDIIHVQAHQLDLWQVSDLQLLILLLYKSPYTLCSSTIRYPITTSWSRQ